VPSFRPSAAYTFPLLHPPPPRTPGFHDPFLARVSGCNNAALSPSDKIQRVPDPIYVCSFQSIKPTPSLCRTPFRRSCPSGFPPGGQCFSVAAGGQRIVPPWFVPGALLLLLLTPPKFGDPLVPPRIGGQWTPHVVPHTPPPPAPPSFSFSPVLLLPLRWLVCNSVATEGADGHPPDRHALRLSPGTSEATSPASFFPSLSFFLLVYFLPIRYAPMRTKFSPICPSRRPPFRLCRPPGVPLRPCPVPWTTTAICGDTL
jgi:hypothetical protein